MSKKQTPEPTISDPKPQVPAHLDGADLAIPPMGVPEPEPEPKPVVPIMLLREALVLRGETVSVDATDDVLIEMAARILRPVQFLGDCSHPSGQEPRPNCAYQWSNNKHSVLVEPLMNGAFWVTPTSYSPEPLGLPTGWLAQTVNEIPRGLPS